MGRKKNYTEKSFQDACAKYFNSISAERPVQELYDTGRTNKSGYPVMAYRDVMMPDGKTPMKQRVYFVPPSMLDLYLYLGITKQTASNYKKRGGLYEKALIKADLMVEAYKARTLNEGKKRLQGVIFDLECNHGWSPNKKDDENKGGGVIVLPEITPLEPPAEESDE